MAETKGQRNLITMNVRRGHAVDKLRVAWTPGTPIHRIHYGGAFTQASEENFYAPRPLNLRTHAASDQDRAGRFAVAWKTVIFAATDYAL